jgi:hypothetical protein
MVWVNSVSYSPDGRYIASGSYDGTIKIWDATTGALVRTLTGHSDWVFSVSYSPDGRYIASGSRDGTIKIWDATTGALSYVRSRGIVDLGSIASVIVPMGVILPRGVGMTGTIKIWDATTGAELRTLTGHSDWVSSVSYSPDGRYIASGSEDNTIKIWDATTGALVRTLTGHSSVVYSVSYSPDGRYIASGSWDGTIKIWDATTGALVRTLTGHSGYVLSVSYSPDGRYIASGSWDGTIKIWDATTGTLVRTLTGHSSGVNSVSYSPDGRYIASGSWDATVKVWAVDDFTLQEDESDNVFSIVEPIAKSMDIDMGKVLVSSVKDSVVSSFVQNPGTWKFRVDSIYFRGADATAFSLVSGFPKYEVKPGDTHYGEFRFRPSRVGIHTAEIVIITQSDTLVQTIRGEGVDPQLQVATDVLDFGKVEIGDEKIIRDTLLLKNISNNAITITNTVLMYPDKEQFEIVDGGGSFVLQPNEGRKLSIKFKPKYGGRTSGGVGFEYNGVGSPVVAQLFGTGIGGRVYLPRDSGYAGETKIYKLTLANIKPEGLMAIANQFRARIRFQSTILAAPTITEKEFISDSTYITIRGALSNSSTLAEIPFVAGLGSVEETSIDIVEMKIFDSNGNEVEYDFEKESGQFTLLGICNEGGKRLINPGKVTQLLKIAPNPSDGNVKIELNLVEDGTTILRIYNWQGVAIEERRYTEAGKVEITLNTENYATGLYLVELQTPTIVKRELLIISR